MSLRAPGAASGDVFGYSLSNNFTAFIRNRFDSAGNYASPALGFITAATNPAQYVWPLPVPSNKNIWSKPKDPTDYTSPIVLIGNERGCD